MTTQPIAGIERARDSTDAPPEYLSRHSDPPIALRDAIDALRKATSRKLGYWDDEMDGGDGGWVKASGFQAVVNPDWLGPAGLQSCPKYDAMWYPRTDSYDPVNPDEMWYPLIDAMDSHDLTGVFGESREYRLGGEFHLDVLFPQLTVSVPQILDPKGEHDPFVLGVTTGSDHFGATSLYARPIAFDPNSGQVLRNIGEKQTRRHVKPKGQHAGETAHKVAAWWSDVLESLQTVGDALYQAVVDASTYYTDFDGVPKTPEDYYTGQGIPDNIARAAHDSLGGSTVDDAELSAWTLHHSLLAAIEAEFDGKTDGGAMHDHIRVANRILFEPPRAEANAFSSWYYDEVAADSTQTTIDGTPLTDVYRERETTAAEKTKQYRSMKERMQRLMADAQSPDGEDSDDSHDSTDENDMEAEA